MFQHHNNVPHGVHSATSGRGMRRARMLQRARQSPPQQSIAHLQREMQMQTLPRRPGISGRVAAVLAEAQAAARASQDRRDEAHAEDNEEAVDDGDDDDDDELDFDAADDEAFDDA